MENKKKKGTKIVLVIFIVLFIISLGVLVYGYSKYNDINSKYNDLNNKYNDISNKYEELNKTVNNQNNTIDNEDTINNDNNTISQNNNTSNKQNNNYRIVGKKHIYSSEENASVYAINDVMYMSSSEGSKKLDIKESKVNKAVIKESAQGLLAYILKNNGSVIRYYYGYEFNKRKAFSGYKVKNLTINCKAGEDGNCSIRTYTLTLFDGSSKIVKSDE